MTLAILIVYTFCREQWYVSFYFLSMTLDILGLHLVFASFYFFLSSRCFRYLMHASIDLVSLMTRHAKVAVRIGSRCL